MLRYLMIFGDQFELQALCPVALLLFYVLCSLIVTPKPPDPAGFFMLFPSKSLSMLSHFKDAAVGWNGSVPGDFSASSHFSRRARPLMRIIAFLGSHDSTRPQMRHQRISNSRAEKKVPRFGTLMNHEAYHAAALKHR